MRSGEKSRLPLPNAFKTINDFLIIYEKGGLVNRNPTFLLWENKFLFIVLSLRRGRDRQINKNSSIANTAYVPVFHINRFPKIRTSGEKKPHISGASKRNTSCTNLTMALCLQSSSRISRQTETVCKKSSRTSPATRVPQKNAPHSNCR